MLHVMLPTYLTPLLNRQAPAKTLPPATSFSGGIKNRLGEKRDQMNFIEMKYLQSV